MTTIPSEPGNPRRPHGPRDPGDAWVVAPTGERYWGRFGAAGLLAHDPVRGILLQHRVAWSHFGGTWGLPGGARHLGEGAADAALRESAEEAGVPREAVRPRILSVADRTVWAYTTLVADVVAPFEPVIGDPESVALEWVPVDEVTDRELHPGFASSWTHLRDALGVRPAIVVDAANVIGSVPDGWWNDRPAAASRLLSRLDALAVDGVASGALGLSEHLWFPRIVAVLEGQSRSAAPAERVETVFAHGSGDDAIVGTVTELVASGHVVTVVTADRELIGRVGDLGASTQGPTWLLDQLDA